MYHSTDESYLQSTAIKKGEYQLAKEDQEMVDWITAITGVKALNFYFSTVETFKGHRVQHISVIVERIAECKKLEHLPQQQQIIQRFQQYFDEQGRSNKDKLKNDVFPRVDNVYPETTLNFRSLEEVELKITNSKADEQIKAIAEDYPEIWVIMSDGWRTVFYYTDEQLEAGRSNGMNNEIKAKALKILKQHDPHDYFNEHWLQLYFDSKESFDRDYDGNWYYYYK